MAVELVPAKRTKIGVLETTPAGLVAMVIAEAVKLFVFVAEICHPAGGVIVTGAARFDPLKLKLWLVEFVPSNVVKPDRDVLLTGKREGALELTTVPRSETLLLAPPPASVSAPTRLFVTGAMSVVRIVTTPPVGASVREKTPGVSKLFVEIW